MTLKEEIEILEKRVRKLEKIVRGEEGPENINVKMVALILKLFKVVEEELKINLTIERKKANSLLDLLTTKT